MEQPADRLLTNGVSVGLGGGGAALSTMVTEYVVLYSVINDYQGWCNNAFVVEDGHMPYTTHHTNHCVLQVKLPRKVQK